MGGGGGPGAAGAAASGAPSPLPKSPLSRFRKFGCLDSADAVRTSGIGTANDASGVPLPAFGGGVSGGGGG